MKNFVFVLMFLSGTTLFAQNSSVTLHKDSKSNPSATVISHEKGTDVIINQPSSPSKKKSANGYDKVKMYKPKKNEVKIYRPKTREVKMGKPTKNSKVIPE